MGTPLRATRTYEYVGHAMMGLRSCYLKRVVLLSRRADLLWRLGGDSLD